MSQRMGEEGLMGRGKFIVIEGIDGAGTTTQVAKLVQWFRERNIAARGTREPSDGPVGLLLRQMLTGRVVVPGSEAPHWTTMALLFAADRADHLQAEIEPCLAAGCTVVSDRYDASSLAYQSASSGQRGSAAVDWIRSLNHHARRPDLTVVIDVPAEVAAQRRALRGEPDQLFEKLEFQKKLALFYKELPRHMPHDAMVVVDGNGTLDEVFARVLQALAPVFAENTPK